MALMDLFLDNLVFLRTSAVKMPIITSQNGNVIVDWKDMACRYLYTFDYKRSHGF